MISRVFRQIENVLFFEGSLRVLMYHSVSGDGHRDALTVDSRQLEQHFQYLRAKGYTTILLSDLVAYYDHQRPLPPYPVLITFDDGFRNNLKIALPLAKKYGMKINLFLVPAFIMSGMYKNKPCLRAEDLQQLDHSLVEIGLHSCTHASYAEMILPEVNVDILRCRLELEKMGVLYQPCLAYPYGAYPRGKKEDQALFFKILDKAGIRLAFRIGNRINALPLKNKFLIQRLDIRGDEPLLSFKMSLAFGRKLLGWPRPVRYAFFRIGKKMSSQSLVWLAFLLGMIFFLLIAMLIRSCSLHSA